MKLRNVLLALALTVTACGGSESADNASTVTQDDAADVNTPASAPEAVALTGDDELTSDTPSPAPTSSTTTTAPSVDTTTSTTTSTTTTVVEEDLGGDPGCATPNYEILLPAGWHHEDCSRFSETPFPGPNADIEFRPEIDLHFTTAETFREALMRIDETEAVLWSEAVTVNGRRAVRMEIDEGFLAFFGENGRRMTWVVDAGQGVFFAAGVELVDAGSVQLYDSRADQYANTLSTLDVMMRDLAVSWTPPAPVTCPDVSYSYANSELVNSGQVDVNGDGDLETFQLIYDLDSNNTMVTIEGLVPGIISGEVESGYPDPFKMLGWADWDGDGIPEIVTREGSGPATGDLQYVWTVVGCDIVPVTGLLSTGSTQYSDSYRCNIDADGTMTSLTQRSLRIDVNVDPITFATTTTESTYIAGVLITAEPFVNVTDEQAEYDMEDALTWGLAPCAELFDNKSERTN